MTPEFACPECGNPVRLRGHAPGRQLRCEECGTVVEVPFLPRVAKSPRRSAPLIPPVIWALAGMVSLLSVAIIAAKQAWRSQARASATAAMARLREPAEQAWQADQLDEAVAAFDAALKRDDLPWEPEVARSFRDRRESAARRLAERELDRLEHLGPEEALRDGLALHRRIDDDPNLEPYRDRARDLVRRAVARLFDRDLEAAGQACDAGQVGPAMKRAEGLQQLAVSLPHWAGNPAPDRLVDLMKRIAARHGAVVEPIRGSYWLGSVEAYDKALRPVLLEALRARGYAAEPADPGLAPIWNELAPNRISLAISERPGGLYLQSANPVAHLEGRLVLQRPGKLDWKQTVQAQTEVPLPRLPAYEASHLAISKTPSPETQQRFHDNAFHTLVGRIGKVAAAIPQAGQ